MRKEQGFVVCRGSRYTRGRKVTGNSNSVSIPVECPRGSRPVAIHHTHPGGSLALSAQDKATALQFDLPMCVKARGKVKCYRVRPQKQRRT